MVDGGVSIAVRSVYPGKQARISCPIRSVAGGGKTAGKVVRRAQSFVGHKWQSDHRSQGERSEPFRVSREVAPCLE